MDVNDPAAVWSTVLERALEKPSWAWLRYVQLQKLDADRATLAVVPGHREVYGFATEARLAQIAKVVEDVVGRRVKVVIDREASSTATVDDADPAAIAGNASPPAGGDRREAMNLPLVRQVFEIFPEASLINIRDET